MMGSFLSPLLCILPLGVGVASAVLSAVSDPPKVEIPDFDKLECELHQLAFEFGSKIVPTSPQVALRAGR
jgi:hypothetical protein